MAATAIDTLARTVSLCTTPDQANKAFIDGLITAISAAITSDAGIANTAITVVRDRLIVNKPQLNSALRVGITNLTALTS